MPATAMNRSFEPDPEFGVTEMLGLAQNILAAAHALQNGRCPSNVFYQLREWAKAGPCLTHDMREFKGSTADKATRRAIGMLTRGQAAKDEAVLNLESALLHDEALRARLADHDSANAAWLIAGLVIDSYLTGLTRGQR